MAKNKQINFRTDDDLIKSIEGIAEQYHCSVSRVLTIAVYTLADVLYEGESYENKITALCHSVENMLSV